MNVKVDRRAILDQIGFWNVGAISGGRVAITENGISLPVSNGYSVEVDYDYGSDTYTVKRVFKRGSNKWVQTKEQVYCTEVGEIAYQASCFQNVDFGVKVKVAA